MKCIFIDAIGNMLFENRWRRITGTFANRSL